MERSVCVHATRTANGKRRTSGGVLNVRCVVYTSDFSRHARIVWHCTESRMSDEHKWGEEKKAATTEKPMQNISMYKETRSVFCVRFFLLLLLRASSTIAAHMPFIPFTRQSSSLQCSQVFCRSEMWMAMENRKVPLGTWRNAVRPAVVLCVRAPSDMHRARPLEMFNRKSEFTTFNWNFLWCTLCIRKVKRFDKREETL